MSPTPVDPTKPLDGTEVTVKTEQEMNVFKAASAAKDTIERVDSIELSDEVKQQIAMATTADYLAYAQKAGAEILKNPADDYRAIGELSAKNVQIVDGVKFEKELADKYPKMKSSTKMSYIAELAVKHPEEFEKLKQAWGKEPADVFIIQGKGEKGEPRDIALIKPNKEELADMKEKMLSAQNKKTIAKKMGKEADLTSEESFWDKNKTWILSLLGVVAVGLLAYFGFRDGGWFNKAAESLGNIGGGNGGNGGNGGTPTPPAPGTTPEEFIKPTPGNGANDSTCNNPTLGNAGSSVNTSGSDFSAAANNYKANTK